MTLPTSGIISLASVNAEVGSSVNSLAWVRANTYYGYADLNSIRGLTWFNAISSQNNVSRSAGATTTNCVANCTAQRNNSGYDGAGGWSNCNLIANANCNQCGYGHGTYLQANCNCNCNCYVCNCSYNNCNCNCNCDCNCSDTG